VPFASGILAALVAVLIYGALTPAPAPLSRQDVGEQVASALASVTPPPAFSELAFQAIQPSLVLVRTTSKDAKGADQSGIGSGVVVDAAGDILTCLHVIAGATDIELTFADGTTSSAEVVAQQPDHDIAVIRPTQLPATIVPATLGNPRSVQIGDDAFVVGNPFGLHSSMSTGVVSGLGRSFKGTATQQQLTGLIQVDAAVNPGNSGGPLLDRAGRVVGIVVALVNPTKEDVFIGIGLAVPIDVAGGAAGAPPY
jgi:S1-C subfamily serine protease